MPVDTHVFRVSRRIGLASNVKSFLKVENQLVANLPKEKITKATIIGTVACFLGVVLTLS